MPPIETDPPVQREWRRLLNPFFSPVAIAGYEQAMRAFAIELIDCFVEQGTCDLATDFAWQFPPAVVFQLVFGVSKEELPQVKAWAEAIVYSPDSAAEGFARLSEWIIQLIHDRSKQPHQGGVVDGVLRGTIAGKELSFEDMIGPVMILVLGALDTTSSALGNICRHLAEDGSLLQRLRYDSHQIGPWLEEFLRFDPPSTGVVRTATCDAEVRGRLIREGEQVFFSLLSANHDESVFPDPDRLDLDRVQNRHLTFGAGAHRCIGSNLARLILRVAIDEVVSRLEHLRLKEGTKVIYHPALVRGPRIMPVTFSPGRRSTSGRGNATL